VSSELESPWIEGIVAKLEVLGSFPYTALGRPLRLQKVEVPTVSRKSAREGGKVVSPTHRPPLPPRRPAELTPRPEGLSQ
jgi:hypothetical protein